MTTPRRSPTVRRRRLSHILKQLREDAGLTANQVSSKLEWSKGKLSRMETNQWIRPDIGDMRHLLELYGVTDEDRRAAILDLARESRQLGWWTDYRDVFADSYVEFEAEASRIQTYEPLFIPGLLQTPEHATSLGQGSLSRDPAAIERRVQARMERQQLLTHEDPVQLWAVIDEAALIRQIGTPDMRREQLLRLMNTAPMDHVTVQVLPLSAGAHPGLTGGFSIMDFPDVGDPSIVYVETGPNGLYMESRAELDRYRLMFQHISATALSPDASIAYLSDLFHRLE